MTQEILTIDKRKGIKSPVFLIIITAWLGALIILARQGVFIAPDGNLPIAMPLSVLVAPIVFLILLKTVPSVREWADGIDLQTATSMQSWRVIGGTFIFLWGLGELPTVFAFFAGFGDVGVGLVAAFATLKIAQKDDGWQTSARKVIFIGLLDFAFAIVTGLSSAMGYLKLYPTEVSASKMMAYPMVLFPVFLVPLFMVFHILAWRKLK